MSTEKTKGILLMGVSGCGKTTVGKSLAKQLGWTFFDADDFHPEENIQKMASGIPLSDADRLPWLMTLQNLLRETIKAGRHPILACSALKECYRVMLLAGNQGVKIVYLKGSYELILERMLVRADHYMKPSLLQSQFDLLEEPKNAIVVDIVLSPAEIQQAILSRL